MPSLVNRISPAPAGNWTMSSEIPDQLDLRHELRRKAIHLSSALLPLAYQFYLSREQIVLLSGTIMMGLIAGEVLRRYWHTGTLLFEKIFSSLLRGEEKHKLTGATHLFISATVTFLIFEKSVAVPAILILTLSDSMAAIIGKSFGRQKIFAKTVEGSITFFSITAGIFYLMYGELTPYLIFTAGVITVLEMAPLRVNDNLLLGPGTALLLMLGQR